MKYLKLILILVLTINISSCYKQKKYGDNDEEKLTNNFYVFKGTIDDIHSIVLGMYINGNKISGYYFFDTLGVKKTFTGEINKEQFTFYSENKEGKKDFLFTARLHDKERLKGEFTDFTNMHNGVFKARIQDYQFDSKSAYISTINLFKESTYSPRISIPFVMLAENDVADRINKHLDCKSVTGYTLSEINDEIRVSEQHHGMIHGIVSSDFAQKYNRENILCLRVINQSITTNHDKDVRFYCFDLKNGEKIYGKDLLNPFTLKDLVLICDNALQQNIMRKIKELKHEDYVANSQLFKNHKFTMEDLDKFYIEENSIVFYYDFNFPRQKQDLLPNDELSFSFSEIKKFLNKKGPLKFMFEEMDYQKRKKGIKVTN